MKSRFSFVQFLVFLAVLVLGIFSPLYAHRATPSANKTEKVSYNKSEFFADIAPTIQEVAEAYGVRPSLVIAQAALESDYGQNLLAVKYHNLFAVFAQLGNKPVTLKYKCYFVNEWQTEIGQFAVYKSWDDAIYDYFDLLKSGKIRNSEGAYDVMVSNKGYKKPAQALQDMGFSSDPNYASKLIAIIEENDLTTYDK
ncbi:glucosaminidase domain-containing protein [Streptococcus lutetiensis]|uniref:glycoside hydrolase family 73 protein n=1 Tax=Streptococcus lutetiensis TaxID=150055 RepID=UPI001BD9C2DE|nr:glucosaminidase domain-containing protein [Streptococcus lutetiensis]MBT0906385.1 glucosaminidase domain-containing protein [Streptococcus lutetiensis]